MVLFAQHASTLSCNTSEWETRCLMLSFQGEVDLFSGERGSQHPGLCLETNYFNASQIDLILFCCHSLCSSPLLSLKHFKFPHLSFCLFSLPFLSPPYSTLLLFLFIIFFFFGLFPSTWGESVFHGYQLCVCLKWGTSSRIINNSKS